MHCRSSIQPVRFATLLVVPAILFLSGCATLSEADCRASTWSDIGFRDGRNGRPEDRITEHTKACGKYSIEPDREAYFEGRSAGLPHYCTSHVGFVVGRAGGTYEGVCPRPDEDRFLDGFSKGQALRYAHERLDRIESDITRVDEKREKADVNEEERKALTQRRIELEGERGSAQEIVRRLEWESEQL